MNLKLIGDENSIFSVHGWKDKIPEVGQTLLEEFKLSWVKFEFIEIKKCNDPPDMFFAKVKPIEQILKKI